MLFDEKMALFDDTIALFDETIGEIHHQQPKRPEVEALLSADNASLAQLVEHALRKRMVVGSIPTGGS